MVTSRILFTANRRMNFGSAGRTDKVCAISRALERRNKTGVLADGGLNGGIAPAPRCRAVAGLKLEEREEISRGIAAGRSVRRIARGLKRSPSTISREIRRNGGRRLPCEPGERSAWERALRLSLVAWRSMGSYDGAWRRSLRCNGRRAVSVG